LNGGSAGGLAVYTWLDTVAEYIHARNPAAKVYGLADSGFFLDYPSFTNGTNDYTRNIKAVVDLVNHGEVPLPNKKCMAANSATNPHHCLMAQYLVKYIETPLFITQSLYDTWQIPSILNIPCTKWPPYKHPFSSCNDTELAAIQLYRDETFRLLQETFDMSNSTRSVWAPSCPFHGRTYYGTVDDPVSASYVVPANSNNTLGLAANIFIYQNVTEALIDSLYWPENAKCAQTMYQYDFA